MQNRRLIFSAAAAWMIYKRCRNEDGVLPPRLLSIHAIYTKSRAHSSITFLILILARARARGEFWRGLLGPSIPAAKLSRHVGKIKVSAVVVTSRAAPLLRRWHDVRRGNRRNTVAPERRWTGTLAIGRVSRDRKMDCIRMQMQYRPIYSGSRRALR